VAPGVAAFDDFALQTGGATGGWDAADHAAFLSVWSRYLRRAEVQSMSESWAHDGRFLAAVRQ
jgi:hypothetical protein